MIEVAPARDREQRTRDTLLLLEQEIDAWIATADDHSGTPYLIPLSFLWDGSTLLIATFATSPTARNLRSTGKIRLGLGAMSGSGRLPGAIPGCRRHGRTPFRKSGSDPIHRFPARSSIAVCPG